MIARFFTSMLPVGAAALLGLVPMMQPSAAAPHFDGRWSVAIVAESGDCAARYTVPIEVSEGRVRYAGPFSAEASGRVGAAGLLDVTFSYGSDVVSARGSLSDRSGYGSWNSPTQECGGTWRASRRA